VEFTRKGLMELIHRYTKESGVRGLEREIATLCRKVAKNVLRTGNREEKQRVTAKRVHKLLDHPATGTARPRTATRSGWSRAWPGPKWAASCCRPRSPSCPARAS